MTTAADMTFARARALLCTFRTGPASSTVAFSGMAWGWSFAEFEDLGLGFLEGGVCPEFLKGGLTATTLVRVVADEQLVAVVSNKVFFLVERFEGNLRSV